MKKIYVGISEKSVTLIDLRNQCFENRTSVRLAI